MKNIQGFIDGKFANSSGYGFESGFAT